MTHWKCIDWSFHIDHRVQSGPQSQSKKKFQFHYWERRKINYLTILQGEILTYH